MVELDKMMRSFGFIRYARKLKSYPEGIVEAYAKGVNDYVRQAAILPVEFYIVGTTFDEWTVDDTYLLTKLTSFETSYRWVITVSRQAILEKYGKAWADLIIPLEMDESLGSFSTVLSDAELKAKGKYKASKPAEPSLGFNFNKKIDVEAEKKGYKPWRKTGIDGPKATLSATLDGASNSWAIHGNYTKSGKPLLSSDPHLSTRVPSVLYMSRAKMPDGTAFFGGMMPGTPYFVYGRSDYIAWGATVSYTESIDLFKLKLNKETTHYYYNRTWVPLRRYEDVIKVKGAPDVHITNYATHHGPVMFPLPRNMLTFPSYGVLALIESPAALAWAGFYDDDEIVVGTFKLMMAHTTKQAVEALKHYGSASEGIVFATVSFAASHTHD